MGTLTGVVVLFAALILIGIVFGAIEERKRRRGRRAGERPRVSQAPARVVISQRVPSVTEALRGEPRARLHGRGP